jgi:hypothetical protein
VTAKRLTIGGKDAASWFKVSPTSTPPREANPLFGVKKRIAGPAAKEEGQEQWTMKQFASKRGGYNWHP